MPDSGSLSTPRDRMDKATERIVARLHDRAGFKQNRSVYVPGDGRMAGRAGMKRSYLLHSLEGLEAYHASLDRYEAPGEYRLILDGAAEAEAAGKPLPGMAGELIPFYVDEVVPRLCAPGDDPGDHGETVYVDADLLLLLHERINIGRDVAAAKAREDPAILLVKDRAALIEKLRVRDREERVVAYARSCALRYRRSKDDPNVERWPELDPNLVEFVFRRTIEMTIELEAAVLLGDAKP